MLQEYRARLGKKSFMNMNPCIERSAPVDVSVIIPTYNRGPLLIEAIDSVFAQTYKNVEVIVVDDGSSDDTLERLEPYRSKISIVNTNHGGAPHARNAGMKVAKGRYVAFLDSDDRYLPHKLALQVQILDRFPDVGAVYSEFSGFGQGMAEEFHLKTYHAPAFRNGKTYEHYFNEALFLKEACIDCPPWSDRKMYFGHVFDQYLRVLFIFTNSLMVRRDLLDSVGFHDESLSLFDGYDLVLRIAKRKRIAFVDVPTYQLRYHDGQISTTKRPDGPAILVAKQRQLLSIVERHGVQDRRYYQEHRGEVDATMAKLFRALGIALMCYPGHEAEARRMFREGGKYGLSEPGFCFLTFLPTLPRRVVMKVQEVIGRSRKRA
jgi:glycosyltransferase involved in cell wall biosynthesis